MNYPNPIISTNNHRLTSGFGNRPNPTGSGTEMHNGADFTDRDRLERIQDVGILAVADGTVAEVINGALVGWTVAVSHGGGILSRYQHMKSGSIRVKAGDSVTKGKTIGTMGTTGRSTAVHLHLGIQEGWTSGLNGRWVDPLPYLTGAKSIGTPAQHQTPQTPISGAAAATPFQKGADTAFGVGDKVRVSGVAVGAWGTTYTGGTFRVWHPVYDVIQVDGDRVVIGIGGSVTAAVNAGVLVKT